MNLQANVLATGLHGMGGSTVSFLERAVFGL